ncbi:MAG TPA: glutathione S-transferase family protein [Kofleriaceae bacterium]|nr:glutathione S-transferase family protein [Kofleriaceae bacterium]
MRELLLHVPPGRAWGTPNMSPFCGKLETYLRMADLPHKVVAAAMTKAPKGKIPFVTIDGELMGDSQLVIERLERTSGHPLDADLSPRDRATGRAVRRMIEEGTYFTGVHLRWATDEGFGHVRKEMGSLLPAPIRLLLPIIRRKVKKSLHAQGTGRHGHEEICAMAIADWQAVSDLLGDRPFLLGDAPHVVDATLYAFLEGVLRFPADSPVKQAVAGMANLVGYRDRIRARWWKDLDQAAAAA